MNRVKVLIVAVLLLGAFINQAQAQNTKLSGEWWNSLTQAAKVEYVHGYFDGSFSVIGSLDAVLAVAGEKYGKDAKELELLKWAIEHVSQSFSLPSGIIVGRLVEGVDNFYSVDKNKEVSISAAVFIVYMELRGESKEEIERTKEFWRNQKDTTK